MQEILGLPPVLGSFQEKAGEGPLRPQKGREGDPQLEASFTLWGCGWEEGDQMWARAGGGQIEETDFICATAQHCSLVPPPPQAYSSLGPRLQ